MMDWCRMMGFVDRDGRVNDMRLNSLFINHRLDMLMYVMMNSFACENRSSLGGVSGAVGLSGVSVFGSFSVECSSSVLLIAVVKGLVLYRNKVVVVLLGKSLLVGNGLDSCMMVLLVNLLVKGSGYTLMLVRLDVLLSDVRLNVFVNSGSVLSVVGKEARNGLLCFLHCV